MQDCLQQAREMINEVDAQMARLFEKRMEAVRQVIAYKKRTTCRFWTPPANRR